MNPILVALALGSFPVILTAAIAWNTAQRKDTGKRIGAVEKRLDYRDGYDDGYKAAMRERKDRER